jgi:hypothetical protein
MRETRSALLNEVRSILWPGLARKYSAAGRTGGTRPRTPAQSRQSVFLRDLSHLRDVVDERNLDSNSGFLSAAKVPKIADPENSPMGASRTDIYGRIAGLTHAHCNTTATSFGMRC